jgi:hypothetical protein
VTPGSGPRDPGADVRRAGTLGFVWRSIAVLLVDLSRAPPARVRWSWHDGALEPSGFALTFSDTPSSSASCSTPSCHSHPRSTRPPSWSSTSLRLWGASRAPRQGRFVGSHRARSSVGRPGFGACPHPAPGVSGNLHDFTSAPPRQNGREASLGDRGVRLGYGEEVALAVAL